MAKISKRQLLATGLELAGANSGPGQMGGTPFRVAKILLGRKDPFRPHKNESGSPNDLEDD